MPICEKVRWLPSRDIMNVKTCVSSVCSATASRSVISAACASKLIRNPQRLLDRDVGALLRLVALNPPLDLADVVEVVVDARAIVRAESGLQRPHVAQDAVEDAAILTQVVSTLRVRAAVAEETARRPRAG